MAENKTSKASGEAQELTKKKRNIKLPAVHLKTEMRHYRGQQRREGRAFMYR